MMKPKAYQCSTCYRIVSVWVNPPQPYVCLMCKSNVRFQAKPKPKNDTKTNWCRATAYRLAEEMSVTLDPHPDGESVREAGDKRYTSWLRMYGRLYSRRRKGNKKRMEQ